MPIYEYQCQDCDHEFEVMQRMSDDLLTTCPMCKKEGLKKLISRVGFQLKGTGWYETDFKNKGKQTPEADKKKTEGADKNKTEKGKKEGTQSSGDKQSAESNKTSSSSATDT